MKCNCTLQVVFRSALAMLFFCLPFLSAAQGNNDCTTATTLTSSFTTCSYTTGQTVVGAVSEAGAPAACAGIVKYDVWYKFVAQSNNPTISLAAIGANFSAQTPRIQVFSGTCGSLTSIGCGTTSYTPTGLLPGNTYYIRIYSTTTNPVPTSNANFDICVLDAVPNACGSAISLTSSTSCVNISGTIAGSTNDGTSTACGTSRYDVWYTFVAKAVNPTITLSSIGSNFTNPKMQLMSGVCGALSSVSCSSTSGATQVINTTGLTVGNTYYIRVFSTVASGAAPVTNGDFDICVTDPIPVNDECTGAILLTAGTACTNTTTNAYGASASALSVSPCTGTVMYDLWYYFVAPSATATISLSSINAALGASTNLRTQLLSGDCDGGLTSVACGTNTLAATGLTPGDYYFVRVYSTGAPPPSQTNASFSICVTFVPTLTVPANDDCSGATNFTVNNTCVETLGTMVNATASGIASACGGATGVDVWYKFTALSAGTTINTNDFGTNYPANANRRMQLFSGSCGALNALFCISGTSITATGLTVGTVYYIRVFITNTTAPNSLGDFTICVTNTASSQRAGNSYVNITKQTTGGVVEPGDILEIRMAVNHTSGTITKIRYVDNLPTNTSIVAGSTLRVLSNEGTALSTYTLAADADGGTFKASPPAGEYNIRMNLNFDNTVAPPSATAPANNTETETISATGQLTKGNAPSVFGNALFATAFRVQVTGAVGSIITLGTGKFLYNSGGTDLELTTTPYQILVSSPMSLCANSTGVNMSNEYGGTFGTGTTLNRPTDLTTPIPGYDYVQTSSFQSIGDRQYSIVKNLSPRNGTLTNAERQPSQTIPLPSQLSYKYRMHDGHWDIDGDHTSTANNLGNGPTNDGTSGGYMLVVNADFVSSETYRQTLTNLCPNTYYEFSAWFRNICPTCGNNYAVPGSNWSPRQPGVKPNLSFALDGIDRYNTGEIPYYSAGTTANGWVKKGFVFITGPTQTSATLSIRNNSQGGGGNDWAMDDITIATCLPSLTYTPTLNPTACQANALTINNTVRSYFSNYNYYKWQRSTNGGNTWSDISGQSGSATPTLVSGQWEYPTSYTVPPANTTLANNGDQYRLIVATTAANLNGSTCQVTDGVSQVALSVIVCSPVLGTDFHSFNAKVENGNAVLRWTTSKESAAMKFIIERSVDGHKFTEVGTMDSRQLYSNNINPYKWEQPYTGGKYYYRVKMTSDNIVTKYTALETVFSESLQPEEIINVINPFRSNLTVDITTIDASTAVLQLISNTGSPLQTQKFTIQKGLNRLSLQNVANLPAGLYTLKVTTSRSNLSKKIVKQ